MREREKYLLDLVRQGRLRLIGPQRKRKLQRRGEVVRWYPELGSWTWAPGAYGRFLTRVGLAARWEIQKVEVAPGVFGWKEVELP